MATEVGMVVEFNGTHSLLNCKINGKEYLQYSLHKTFLTDEDEQTLVLEIARLIGRV